VSDGAKRLVNVWLQVLEINSRYVVSVRTTYIRSGSFVPSTSAVSRAFRVCVVATYLSSKPHSPTIRVLMFKDEPEIATEMRLDGLPFPPDSPLATSLMV
jgi:hypothetical protein